MSTTNDLAIELLRRQPGSGLQDYKLERDYGGPKTLLEYTNEFIQDLPSNLTFGAFPKANPYGRMSDAQKREYDAKLDADIYQAAQKIQEGKVAEAKAELKKDEEESYQQKIARIRAENAYETQNLLKTFGDLERMKIEQTVDARKQLMPLETQQTVEQLRTALPYIDEAAARGLARNLMASKDFMAFKQRQPLAQQAIAASQQAQMSAASQAFGEEARAIAAQMDAATRFGASGSAPRRVA